ncbi:MAG: hypothetical protein JWO79_1146 [Actinomycetia bacterium]|nr:hypothetical protein [Actinomycetes bacterium]
MTADPFGTAARREAVLAAWASSPTRFREDANAEEDLVTGGYAERVLVELAQNAADAATRAGVSGLLRLRIESTDDGPVLSAANTGDPLDDGGVDGLTSLRASAKRDAESAGRFGVGFAAVLAVSDEPEVRSLSGGVRFSAGRTRAEVSSLGGPAAEEATRRDWQVPVLRLAWPCDDPPAEGFATEVRLPLRPAAEKDVRELLADFDPALLLALPGLSSVDVDGRVISRSESGADVLLTDAGSITRWRIARGSGDVPPELLADRPVEERSRTRWSVLAAVPVDDDGRLLHLAGEQVVHAPTPSGEPLSLPVRLVATFPLDPSRRRVPSGPLTEYMADRSARAIAELAEGLAATPEVLALVPRPTLARAELDALLCSAVLAALIEVPLLPLADPELAGERVTGRRAVVADPALSAVVPVLADVVGGLLPAGYSSGRAALAALDALGARRLAIGDAVEAVTSVSRDPSWYAGLYSALGTAITGLADADALAGLPVPLADGRTVTGPRGLLLPGEGLPADAVATLGLRVVHPDAADPLLERLGAQPATPRSLLADERVRAEVAHSIDAEDPDAVAEAILALVQTADLVAGEEPWLAELALPADDGDWYPAGELLIPGSPLAVVLASDAGFGTADRQLLADWGPDVLAAAGCLRTFELADEGLTDLADADEHDLDGIEDWTDELFDVVAAHGAPTAGARVERLLAIRDLELVAEDRWSEALAMIAAAPLRQALAAPAHVLTADGQRIEVPSYSRWWLGSHPVLGGRAPSELRTPDAAALDGLYDVADGADQELLTLLGCRGGLADLLDAVRADPAAIDEVFARLADPARTVTPVLLKEVYPRLAEALGGASVPPPAFVRVAPDRVVAAERAVVLDAPWLLGRLDGRSPVPGGSDPEAVADMLDVPLLSELA